MATRFHLTPEGPKPCSVDPSNPNSRGCSYGEGGHYSSPAEAETAFAEKMGGAVPLAVSATDATSYSSEELRSAIEHFTRS